MNHMSYMNSTYSPGITPTRQTNIARAILSIVKRSSRADPVVTAPDSDSSFDISTSKNLHNERPGRLVCGTLAGDTSFDRVGDLIIPHHIGGSTVVEASIAKPSAMPSGTSAALGKAALHILQLDVSRLICAPPLVIQHAVYSFDPPAETAVFEHEYKDRNDIWHPVCFSGTLDKRVGTRCFVLFKDGTTSCVQNQAHKRVEVQIISGRRSDKSGTSMYLEFVPFAAYALCFTADGPHVRWRIFVRQETKRISSTLV